MSDDNDEMIAFWVGILLGALFFGFVVHRVTVFSFKTDCAKNQQTIIGNQIYKCEPTGQWKEE